MDSVEIYTGYSGSGKTEIVLNQALKYAAKQFNVSVIDLDFTKPSFRSREYRNMLKGKGVNIVAATDNLSNIDLPVVDPRILGVLTSTGGKVLIDLGGDDKGAIILGRFAKVLRERDYQMFFVVNPYRPQCMDIEKLVELSEKIVAVSRLNVSAIIANPNLGWDTTLTDILNGFDKVNEFAYILQMPIALCAVLSSFSMELSGKIQKPLLEIKKMIIPPWESSQIN
jgi:hypothetical protein